jgi:hypothetical protein
MPVTRRVFVSVPADVWLTDAQNDVKWGVVERIAGLGFVPEIFFDPTGRESLSAGRAWSADGADEIMRHCTGAAIIGLPRWTFSAVDGDVLLPTEFSHYEGAIARTIGLPLLVLAEQNLMRRVVFDSSFGTLIGRIPEGADRSWLETTAFSVPFGYWQRDLERRCDVFLGYCGAASEVAGKIRTFLEDGVGATVLDWQRDFLPGRSILEEIEEARIRCTTGVFLFTKDDLPTESTSGNQDDSPTESTSGYQASPRDNVVFEAGYFASAKGKSRVLIIREAGTKMPADLGGDIYASLQNRGDLSGVERTLLQFLASL